MRHRGRWKHEEDTYLIQNFKKLSVGEMAHYLKRGEKATYNRCYRLGLSKTDRKRSNRKRWTQKEKEFLITNYKKFSNRQLGEMLDRSENAVMGMARILGLRKRNIQRK